jgi:TatD DNase family protein
MLFRGYNLGLKKEPSVRDIIRDLDKRLKEEKSIKEIVFCGYGEPLMRLNVVKKVSMWIKKIILM